MLLAVGDFSALFSVKQRLVYAYNVFFSDLLYGVGRTLAVKRVDLFVKITQRFGGGVQCVAAFRHGESSGVNRLTVEFNAVIEHSEHAVHNSYIFAVVLENRTLLNVRFKHILVFAG